MNHQQVKSKDESGTQKDESSVLGVTQTLATLKTTSKDNQYHTLSLMPHPFEKMLATHKKFYSFLICHIFPFCLFGKCCTQIGLRSSFT
jgi:hypothetical protein